MANGRYSYSPYTHYIWIYVGKDIICTRSSQPLPLSRINKNRSGGEGGERGKEGTERRPKLPITQRIVHYQSIQCGCDEISYRYQRQYSSSVDGEGDQ